VVINVPLTMPSSIHVVFTSVPLAVVKLSAVELQLQEKQAVVAAVHVTAAAAAATAAAAVSLLPLPQLLLLLLLLLLPLLLKSSTHHIDSINIIQMIHIRCQQQQ
jgi:hypothetical protein